MKVCSLCKAEKPLTEFHRGGLGRPQSACKACACAKKKAYRDANIEKALERERADYIRRREILLARKRNAPDEVRERQRAKNRTWIAANKEWIRWYRSEMRHVFLAYNAQRRAAQLQATPPWTSAKDFISIYAESRFLSEVSGLKFEVDHIVPLRGKRVCGLHVPWNLQIILASDNRKKNNRFDESSGVAV